MITSRRLAIRAQTLTSPIPRRLHERCPAAADLLLFLSPPPLGGYGVHTSASQQEKQCKIRCLNIGNFAKFPPLLIMAANAAIHGTGGGLSDQIQLQPAGKIEFHRKNHRAEACVDGRVRGHDENWGIWMSKRLAKSPTKTTSAAKMCEARSRKRQSGKEPREQRAHRSMSVKVSVQKILMLRSE